MEHLAHSQTEANLRDAFARESEANRRFLYYAQQADSEGLTDVASLFRSLAEGEAGHAFGHLAFLEDSGESGGSPGPGRTQDNLRRAVEREMSEAETFYPELARQARDEGFGEIAEWFNTLAKAEERHAIKLRETLSSMG